MEDNEDGENSVDASDWLSKIDHETCSLDVSNLSLADALGAAIIRSVPATLLNLKLGGNSFSSMTVRALAALLKQNTSLEHISLDSNPLNYIESLDMLAESLGENKVLRTFSLRRCGISERGCAALSESLQSNTTLLKLDIEYNNCAESDALSIKEHLSRNCKNYNDELAVEAKTREAESNESLLKLQEQKRIEKEKDTMQWMADEKAKREESRRVEMERQRAKELKEQAYKQRMAEINMMEEERKAASKKKGKKGKKAKKKKK